MSLDTFGTCLSPERLKTRGTKVKGTRQGRSCSRSRVGYARSKLGKCHLLRAPHTAWAIRRWAGKREMAPEDGVRIVLRWLQLQPLQQLQALWSFPPPGQGGPAHGEVGRALAGKV